MSRRPVLTEPSDAEWPCIESDTETALLQVLDRVFCKYKSCLRTVKKPPKWKKVEEGEKDDKLSEEEENQRKIFKSQFVVGIQTVMRNLERDRLSGVLLWQDMQPDVLRKALLQLITQHRVPAVGVSNILSTLQQSWPGLTSAAALGLLKSEEPNDFDELVSMIKKYSPVLKTGSSATPKLPVKSQQPQQPSSLKSEKSEENSSSSLAQTDNSTENSKPHKSVSRPIVDAKKFYIYKPQNENQNSKSFSGQSFIAFSEDALCIEVETVKGKRVQRQIGKTGSKSNFGLRPSLGKRQVSNIPAALTTDANRDVTEMNRNAKNKKRQKLDDKTEESEYRLINLKKLQNNPNKKQKIPKKKQKVNRRQKRK